MNKILIGIIVLGSLAATSNQVLGSTSHSSGHNHNTTFNQTSLTIEFQKPLLIPPLLKGEVKDGVRNFDLNVTKGKWEFIDGKFTETYGYNGPILGPVLSLKKGEKTKVNIKNSLSEETTVHWHGGILSQDVDGVHNADIQPNTQKSVEFILNQPAATLWFHPHPMHKTASQVYKGLAGLIYLEDDISENLNIPKTYGVDDFPIVIQDKKLTVDGQLTYSTTHMEKIHGKSGGSLMINGIISPYIDILNGLTRLRVVNGSNATNYDIDLDGKEFYQIASDGGLLSSPISMKKLTLAPGERGEILIDSNELNNKSYLYINGKQALELRKNKKTGLTSIPKTLVEVPEITKNLN
ncbi:MAG: multicopper oxidase family protein, partial [Cetobacterium sp.]